MPTASGLSLGKVKFLPTLICLASGLLPQAAYQDAPKNAPRTAAVSGVVSDGSSGRGVPGAVVSLRGGQVSMSCVTDSKGRFVFRGLPAYSPYNLQTTKPGFSNATVGGRVLTFALTEGQWISDAELTVWRLGGIGGRVVDERGEPIVNAPVRVLTRVRIAGAWQWATGALARTDDRGIYRIGGLTRGTYLVNVPSVQATVPLGTSQAAILGLSTTAATGLVLPKVSGIELGGRWLIVGDYAIVPGGSREAYPVAYYANASRPADATAVEIADGDQRQGVDFVLRPVPASRLAGRVVAPADVTGLVIRLLQEGAESLGVGSEQATALLAPDGSFELLNVPAGRYVLDVSTGFSEINTAASQHLPATPGLVSNQWTTTFTGSADSVQSIFRTHHASGPQSYSARLPVNLGSDGLPDVIVRLEADAAVSGRIVRDDGAALPATVSVKVEPANGDPSRGGQPLDQAAAKMNGGFRIPGLKSGAYFLRVFAPGLLAKSIVVNGADYRDRPFEVAPGSDISDVTVTLTNKQASVSGIVADSKGRELKHGAVILFPADRQRWISFGLEPPGIRIVTNFGTGSYMIARLPADEYFIVAVDSATREIWHDPRFFAAAAAVATRIRLTWGVPVQQDLVVQKVALK